jgi:hypothetical protein
MDLEEFVYFVLVVVCGLWQEPGEELRLAVGVAFILFRRLRQKARTKEFHDDFLSLSWVIDVGLVLLFSLLLVAQLLIWSFQLPFSIWSRFVLFNKFSFKLGSFQIALMLVHRVVNLVSVFFLLVEVYLPSHFPDQLAFSSLSVSFRFFNDHWFFLSWVCELS